MAYGDTYTSAPGSEGDGPDKTVSYTYNPTTAQGQSFLTEYPKEMRLFLEDQERAAAAGVTGVDKIDYAAALLNYESRSDVELFANRRAREYANSFVAQDFARLAAQEAAPLQSSTLGSTTVQKGDNYLDGPDAGTGDDRVGPSVAPAAPAAPTATLGTGGKSAVVTWTAPDNGGSTITRYNVYSSTGGFTAQVDGNTTSATITGLAASTAYTFTVTATNELGTSPASAPSNSITTTA